MKSWEQKTVNAWLCKELRRWILNEDVIKNCENAITISALAEMDSAGLQTELKEMLQDAGLTDKKASANAERLVQARDLHQGKQAHSTL